MTLTAVVQWMCQQQHLGVQQLQAGSSSECAVSQTFLYPLGTLFVCGLVNSALVSLQGSVVHAAMTCCRYNSCAATSAYAASLLHLPGCSIHPSPVPQTSPDHEWETPKLLVCEAEVLKVGCGCFGGGGADWVSQPGSQPASRCSQETSGHDVRMMASKTGPVGQQVYCNKCMQGGALPTSAGVCSLLLFCVCACPADACCIQ
jgi:hypothetical protein